MIMKWQHGSGITTSLTKLQLHVSVCAACFYPCEDQLVIDLMLLVLGIGYRNLESSCQIAESVLYVCVCH